MQLKDAIESRKSVRHFSHKKPDWRKIIRAVDATRFAPAAGNYFVTRFVLVSDKEKIAELAAAAQQDFVGAVDYVVVAVSDDSKLVTNYGDKGIRYCAQQAGAAIENFLLALTELKLATTWVGHFYEEQVRRVLDVPDELHVEALFPIGVMSKGRAAGRSTDFKFKAKGARKMKLEQVLYYDKFGENKMVPPRSLSRDVV